VSGRGGTVANKDLLGMPMGAARHWRAEGEGGMARRYRNKSNPYIVFAERLNV
jgi:hypothetical protein